MIYKIKEITNKTIEGLWLIKNKEIKLEDRELFKWKEIFDSKIEIKKRNI